MTKSKAVGFRTEAGDHIFNVVNILVFTLFTLICVFPFY